MLFAFLMLPTLLMAQDCQDFVSGTFYLKDDAGQRIPNYSITRTKKKQIEKVPNGYVKCKVVWLSDCSYQLIHLKSDVVHLPKGTITEVKIIRTFQNGYDGLASSDYAPDTVAFTMYKVK